MKYTVTAKTADIDNAASSMRIFMHLFGKSGKTARRVELDTPTNDFERGKTDTFHVVTNDVGEVELIVLTCQGGDAWYGEWVEVRRDSDGKAWKFPVTGAMSGDLTEGKDLLVLRAS